MRETSRLVTCQSHLGQLGKALADYHDVKHQLPPAAIWVSPLGDLILVSFFAGLFWVPTLYLARFVTLPVAWVIQELSLVYLYPDQIGWPHFQVGYVLNPYLSFCQIADLGGVTLISLILVALSQSVFLYRWQALWILWGTTILVSLYAAVRINPIDQMVVGPKVISIKPDQEFPLVKADIILSSELASFGDWETFVDYARSSNAIYVAAPASGRKENGKAFNTTLVFGADGSYQGHYDKLYPVPWREYQPWWGTGKFSRGETYDIFTCKDHTFALSICYDIYYSHQFTSFKPDFYLAATSEFSDDSKTLPKWSLIHTRFRAIENRRSFYRNVNGGFSGLVDSNGTYRPNENRIPINDQFSVYAHLGNYPYALLILIFAGRACYRHRKGVGIVS